MKIYLGSIWLLLILVAGCGGESFTSAALSLSPDSGGFADDARAVGDSHRDLGVSAPEDSGVSGESEAATRDVLADPWPADVTVEPMPDGPPAGCVWGSAVGCPCTNCWLFDREDGATDHISCCGAFASPSDPKPASGINLCGEGSFPSPHRAYCDTCACHP